MPVMDGQEALRQIQNIKPDACVILSSGYDEGEATRRFAPDCRQVHPEAIPPGEVSKDGAAGASSQFKLAAKSS
jgi:CheY-like chemotaxis protein